MSAFASMWDAIFEDANLGTDAVYTPAGGTGVDVRVILHQADAQLDMLGGGVVTDTTKLLVRVSEVAGPKRGDTFEAAGVVYTVNADPKRDPRRVVWAIEAPEG